MGGCRCCFRGCENSTRPGLHFFHFPVKNVERCQKWIDFSNNPSFRLFPDNKLRNRNICEEHFRLKMFMNIRKERLVKHAIPTLLKTMKNGKVYDLEKMINDGFAIENFDYQSYMADEYDEYLVEDEDNPCCISYVPPPKDDIPIDEAPIFVQESDGAEMPIESFSKPSSELSKPVKIIKLTPVKRVIKRPIVDVEPQTELKILKKVPKIKILNNICVKAQSPVAERAEVVLEEHVNVKKALQDYQKINELTKQVVQAKEKEEILVSDLKDSKQTITQLERQVRSLKKQLEDAKIDKKPLIQPPKPTDTKSIQTDPEPSPSVKASPKEATPVKPGTLSKPQLFTGIKRYLSNAMSTLLKMEMFGNSEREWKTDEKKLSCEIMSLGNEVYQYFTDEWRLRLPPKSEVNTWMQDNAEEDEEELY